MTALDVLGASALAELAPGSHVSWVVDDPAEYVRWGTTVLADADRYGQRPVVFGPAGEARTSLAPRAALVADPLVDILGGRFEADTMYAMFREQTALARAAGHRGLRLVADMDWLLPASVADDEVLMFELGLDRLAMELDATIVCAYRSASFGAASACRTACVHRLDVRTGPPPQFRLVARDPGTWALAGEVDMAVEAPFAATLSRATDVDPCVIDLAELTYIGVGGLRTLADTSRRRRRRIRLLHAKEPVLRMWQACGYDVAAPEVQITS